MMKVLLDMMVLFGLFFLLLATGVVCGGGGGGGGGGRGGGGIVRMQCSGGHGLGSHSSSFLILYVDSLWFIML